MRNGDNMSFTAVLLTSKADMMREKRNVYNALMLSLYCRVHMNGGVIEDVEQLLHDRVELAELGLSRRELKKLLDTPSKLWHVQQNPLTRKWDLHVDFYSVYHEKMTIRQRNGGRLGGLRRAESIRNRSDNKYIAKLINNDKRGEFASIAYSKERKGLSAGKEAASPSSAGSPGGMPRALGSEDIPERKVAMAMIRISRLLMDKPESETLQQYLSRVCRKDKTILREIRTLHEQCMDAILA